MRVRIENKETCKSLIELANRFGCTMPEAISFVVKQFNAQEAKQNGKAQEKNLQR